MMQKKDFEALNLNPTQKEIFYFVYKNHSCSIKDISKALKFPRASLYRNLRQLIQMEFLETVYINEIKHFKLSPIQQLSYAFLNQKNKSLEKIHKISHSYRKLYHDYLFKNFR